MVHHRPNRPLLLLALLALLTAVLPVATLPPGTGPVATCCCAPVDQGAAEPCDCCGDHRMPVPPCACETSPERHPLAPAGESYSPPVAALRPPRPPRGQAEPPVPAPGFVPDVPAVARAGPLAFVWHCCWLI